MCDVTWLFGYLLREPDIEILKEIMPPRQQNKMLHNDNMPHHKINEPQKVPYGVVQRDKHHICLWNNVRHYRESGMQKHLEEQYNSRQIGREGTEILLNH